MGVGGSDDSVEFNKNLIAVLLYTMDTGVKIFV